MQATRNDVVDEYDAILNSYACADKIERDDEVSDSGDSFSDSDSDSDSDSNDFFSYLRNWSLLAVRKHWFSIQLYLCLNPLFYKFLNKSILKII